MARGTHLPKKEDVPPTRGMPSPGGTVKLKPRSKNKQWKPLDLNEIQAPVETSISNSYAVLSRTDVDGFGCVTFTQYTANRVTSSESSSSQTSFHRGSPQHGNEPSSTQPMASLPKSSQTFETQTSSITARPPGLDEIAQVFPDGLPDPIHLRSNPGDADGEIQFIQHPNRDVTAHKWSTTAFEWTIIGCYSCVRKTIEGHVVSDDFLMRLPPSFKRSNSLAYFCELAEEYGKAMSLFPGTPEPQTVLRRGNPVIAHSRPSFDLNPAATDIQRYDSLSTLPGTSALDDEEFPALGSLSLKDSKGPSTIDDVGKILESLPSQSRSLVRRPTPLRGYKFSEDDPFVEVPANTTERDNEKMGGSFHFPSSLVTRAEQESVGMLSSQPNFSMAQPSGDRRAYFEEQERQRIEKMLQEARSRSSVPPMAKGSHSALSTSPAFHIRPEAQQQQDLSRERMREYLNRLGDEFKSTRPVQQESTARAAPAGTRLNAASDVGSVLHGDLNVAIYGHNPTEPTSSTLSGTGTLRPATFNDSTATLRPNYAAGAENPPASSGSQFSRRELRTSDPEPGYKDRLVSIYNTSGTGAALPTLQNWHGPFFNDDMPTTADPARKSSTPHMGYKEELINWWNSGNLSQRQEEFLKALKRTGPSDNEEEGGFDNNFIVTDRMMLALYENLSSYINIPGEPSKGSDYFARFAPPPEFAIDRSRNGNNSFFGEDYGEVPKRIGRDPRYRPSFAQSRFDSSLPSGEEERLAPGSGGPLSTPHAQSFREGVQELGNHRGLSSLADTQRNFARGSRGGTGMGTLQGLGLGKSVLGDSSRTHSPGTGSRPSGTPPRPFQPGHRFGGTPPASQPFQPGSRYRKF